MSRLPIRRFLFWINYDGSRFPEMARGGTGFGVMDLLHQTVSDTLFGQRPSISADFGGLRFSPSSRTDAGVHAVRNAIICQVPLRLSNFTETGELKTDFLSRCNEVFNLVNPGSMSILDVHPVSAGFCCRRNVSYRRYTYRLAVVKDWKLWESVCEDPSTACFSERNYAWLLPPGLCPRKTEAAGKLFVGEQVMGSFFKHTAREKRQELFTPNALKNILHVELYKGEPYTLENDVYDYYNVTIIAKSFVREQIRRMMSCLVFHGYDRLPISAIQWLLKNPISTNFFDRRIPIAPPNGLFLTDVVYTPEQFHNPIPYNYHSWDYES